MTDRGVEGAGTGAPSSPTPVVPSETAEDLYEHAPCGYVSTLPDGTIIKVNQTFVAMTGHRREDLVGTRRFVDLLTAGGRIYHETHYAPLLAMQGSVREIALDIICADGRRLPVLINAILVRTSEDEAHVIRASVLDATDRREYERELVRARERAEQSEARARLLAQTLQASLIPPSPPAIPGLHVAAAYRPAGAGDEVGGDFYDVFEIARHHWAVVVGDVRGKGTEAATVTALARHTVRAAAMRDPRPSAVLATLNDALLRHDTDRFVTVVFAQLRCEPSCPVQVTIGSGGHALPLRVGGGGIDAVGRAGSLLGVLDDPELHDTTIVLEPGALLFFFTDGIVEGRRGEEFYGEARLTEALVRLHAAGEPDIPKAIVEEVVAFQDGLPRDDIAAVLVGVPTAGQAVHP